ncbi:MAG: nuclear transport factor 2 family protein [bacterium]
MNEEIAATIIEIEKAALNRWGKGDPSGFLEISSKDVVYFDPSLDKRIDGLDELTKYYEAARGKVFIDRFELINPFVQTDSTIAVLTFNYVSFTGSTESRWNCTEVYRKEKGGWKIIQTHWSLTQTLK